MSLDKISNVAGVVQPEVAEAIHTQAAHSSIVQQLGRQVRANAAGADVPVYTGGVTASWVGAGERKPVTKVDGKMVRLAPRKLAAIVVARAEDIRLNPDGFIKETQVEIASAFAKSFDQAVLFGTNSPFAENIGQSTKTQALSDNFYTDVNDGLKKLVDDGKRFTGLILDYSQEPLINTSVDTQGRPLLLDTPDAANGSAILRQGRLLGRTAALVEGAKQGSTVGVMGDFNQVIWARVGDISYRVSSEASIDLSDARDGSSLVHLFQDNLVAVLFEAEYGLHIVDPSAFVKFTV